MKNIKKLALLTSLVVVVCCACAVFSTNIFRTQQTSENLVYTAYIGYTNYLTTHTINPQLQAQIKDIRLKFAATDKTIDTLRLSYETNSALKPQIEATITTLQDQASNIVWLIHYYQR